MVDLVDLTCFGRPVTFRWRKHRWHCLPDQVAIPGPGNHILIRAYALAECGRLPEASRLATAAYEATPASAPPSALMWLAHQIGRCALLAGQLATARRWLTEALARSEDGGLPGPRCLVLSVLATAAAALGDSDAATAAVRDLDRLEPFPFTRPEQELGRAWARVASANCRAGPATGCARRGCSTMWPDWASRPPSPTVSPPWRPSAKDTMPNPPAHVRAHVNVGKKSGESLAVTHLADHSRGWAGCCQPTLLGTIAWRSGRRDFPTQRGANRQGV